MSDLISRDEVLKIVDRISEAYEISHWQVKPSEFTKELKEEIQNIESPEILDGDHFVIKALADEIEKEIKKINSPESMTDGTFDASKDTNTQNIHTGGAQSTGGLTGGEVKSEETYNGVNSQKPVICKPEPLCPPANNQNLKGCGKYIEDMDGVCGIDGLCEKCQGKVQ